MSNQEPSYQAFVTMMLRIATTAPTQYAQLMNQSGNAQQLSLLLKSCQDLQRTLALPHDLQALQPMCVGAAVKMPGRGAELGLLLISSRSCPMKMAHLLLNTIRALAPTLPCCAWTMAAAVMEGSACTVCCAAGYDVRVDVLNTSVAGVVANNSLPSIKVVPPSNASNIAFSTLLMNATVNAPSLLPFNRRHRAALVAAATQVTTTIKPHDAFALCPLV